MRLLLNILVLARADWSSCFAEFQHFEADYYRGVRCDVRHRVRFDWERYALRVRPVDAPVRATICAPMSCTSEMVGRVIAPRFVVPDFREVDVASWPRLGLEVFVDEDGHDVAVSALRTAENCTWGDWLELVWVRFDESLEDCERVARTARDLGIPLTLYQVVDSGQRDAAYRMSSAHMTCAQRFWAAETAVKFRLNPG